MNSGRKWALLLMSLLCVGSCGREKAAAELVYRDPIAYCEAVKTADAPGKNYRGSDVPDWMYSAMHHVKTDGGYVAWRCEDGAVLACENGGITGPCDKRDTSQHPTQGMLDWCSQNPWDTDIPAAATGHYTVYAWRCQGGAPQITRQLEVPDSRGFMPGEWVRVENNTNVAN